MNSYLTLDDMQWQELIQRTTQTFSDLTIKRGFQYFKQGRVRSSELSDPSSGVIDALVQGSVAEPYQVRLRVNSLSDSECSCPVEGACKHMAAVLLDYAQQQGRSIHALVNAHSMSWASSPITPNSLRPRTAAGQAAPSPRNGEIKRSSCRRCLLRHGMSCSIFARLRSERTPKIRFTPKTPWPPFIISSRLCLPIWNRYTGCMPISLYWRSW